MPPGSKPADPPCFFRLPPGRVGGFSTTPGGSDVVVVSWMFGSIRVRLAVGDARRASLRGIRGSCVVSGLSVV